MCPGCYKPKFERYCPACRKQLFDGAKVSHVLPFDPPKDDNLAMYQEQTMRLSISGVQLKYSLRREGDELVLTDHDGQYILKPIPPVAHIRLAGQAPENEHLTMQIASGIFGIGTAANALIYFKDGTPAYLTRRFDLKEDGSKFLQEDMAQLSGRSRQTSGEHFKYQGTYEEIGDLIRRYVPAYLPALEAFFRVVVFNYLFSNGDAHLKNFSLVQTDMGDYALSKAYDLMSTVLHTPNESDTALDLYENDMDNEFYRVFGCYGQENFRALAGKVGINTKRTERILTNMLSSKDKVLAMINGSFLDSDIKQQYAQAYLEKLRRLGMTRSLIVSALNPKKSKGTMPLDVTARLNFLRGPSLTGVFRPDQDTDELHGQNKYCFVKQEHLRAYEQTQDAGLLTIIAADMLTSVGRI